MGTSVKALLYPTDGRHVAKLGEITGEAALISLQSRLRATSSGRQLLRDRPNIDGNSVPMDCAPNTFGHRYHAFMKKYEISADTREPTRYINDPGLAYIMQRYRQVHDFWHVLTDLPITILGELILKLVECRQTGLPMTLLASLFGPLRLLDVSSLSSLLESFKAQHAMPFESSDAASLSHSDMQMYLKIGIPWALETSRKASFLLAVPYERHFHDDFVAFQKTLGLTSFPVQL